MNDDEHGNRRLVKYSPNRASQSELNTMEAGLGVNKRPGLLKCLWRQRSAPFVGSIALSVIALCAGCRSTTETPFPEQPTAKTPVSLAPGDVIKLTFAAASDMNQTQKIRVDGKVSLPLIGEVTAAG